MSTLANSIDIAFLYGRGVVNGRLRGKALLLVNEPINEWHKRNYDLDFDMFVLGSSSKTRVHATLASSTEWVESDPDGLICREPFLAQAAIEHQMQLGELQPSVIFDINEDLYDVNLPTLLCNEDSGSPRRYFASLRLDVSTVDRMPEVLNYVQRELEEAQDDRFAMLAVKHLKVPTHLPIPKETWLPACVMQEEQCISVVYKILNANDLIAEAELWVIGRRFDLATGSQLLSRSLKNGNERVSIATVLAVTEVNT